MSVEWQDLLRVPFLAGGDDPSIGLDCWGICREVARRAGLAFPPHDWGEAEPGAAWSTFRRIGDRWTALGAVGDLLVSDPERKGYASHVSVVVDAERGIVLSTSKLHGPYSWPAFRVPCDYGVWRIA